MPSAWWANTLPSEVLPTLSLTLSSQRPGKHGVGGEFLSKEHVIGEDLGNPASSSGASDW